MAQLTDFKMPIEELRGKLATKQKNITYEGQVEGANTDTLTMGKKSATNFNKYIVIYKRRGKNRFYVKSNTSVNQTANSFRQKGRIALAILYADYILNYAPKGGLRYEWLDDLTTAYNNYVGKNLSVREFLIGEIAQQIGQSYVLGYTVPDYRTSGVMTNALIISQNGGFPSNTGKAIYDGIEAEIDILTYLGRFDTDSNKRGKWNTIRAYMTLATAIYSRSIPVTVEGVKNNYIFPMSQGYNPIVTQSLATASIGLTAHPSTTEQFVAKLFKEDTLKPINRGQSYELYTDAAFTQPFTATSENVMQLWAREIIER